MMSGNQDSPPFSSSTEYIFSKNNQAQWGKTPLKGQLLQQSQHINCPQINSCHNKLNMCRHKILNWSVTLSTQKSFLQIISNLTDTSMLLSVETSLCTLNLGDIKVCWDVVRCTFQYRIFLIFGWPQNKKNTTVDIGYFHAWCCTQPV